MPTQFLLYIYEFPNDAEDSNLYSKCDKASDVTQQLELTSELKSDRLDTVDWGKKRLVDFDDGKNNIYFFNWSKNSVAFDVEMDGSILEEKSFFKILGVAFLSKLD